MLILDVDAERPDVFRLEGWLLADKFPLVPVVARLLMASLTDSLVVDRGPILRQRRQLSGSKLAGWTATATTGIATVIAATRSWTRAAVDDMHQVVGKVAIPAEGAGEPGRSITQIREASGCVEGISDDISSALKEQRFASELIAKQGLEGLPLAKPETTLRPDARQMSQA